MRKPYPENEERGLTGKSLLKVKTLHITLLHRHSVRKFLTFLFTMECVIKCRHPSTLYKFCSRIIRALPLDSKGHPEGLRYTQQASY